MWEPRKKYWKELLKKSCEGFSYGRLATPTLDDHFWGIGTSVRLSNQNTQNASKLTVSNGGEHRNSLMFDETWCFVANGER